jgi:hypothetical protein
MCHGRARFVNLTPLLAVGCARDAFLLTGISAMDKLMSSNCAAILKRAIPNRRLICTVEYATPGAVYLYLGDDEGDHTSRIGFYRVTREGRVEVNQDETDLDHRWAVVE